MNRFFILLIIYIILFMSLTGCYSRSDISDSTKVRTTEVPILAKTIEPNQAGATGNLAGTKAWGFYITEVVSNYEELIIEAINKNDFSLIKNLLIPGSNLYNSQEKLVADLYNKQIQEKLVDFDIKDIQKTENEGTYKVYVWEKVGIKYSEKQEYEIKEFNWIYTVVNTKDQTGLQDIEKWENTVSSIPKETKDESVIKTNSKSTSVDEKYTLPKYYDYKSGKLPNDIITSIEYIVRNKINIRKPEFIFEVYGSNVKSYGLTSDKTKYYIADDYNKINRISIKCNDIFYKQELSFSETLTPNIPECTYGFSLDDWNFDGYLDISLWMYEGGTSLNSPHFYWLWDDDKNCYVRNQELENINGNTYMGIDKENNQIVAATRLSGGYYHGYYKWKAGKIVLYKTEDLEFVEPIDHKTGKARGHYIIKERIDEKMQVTDEYYKD